jgi:multiple sugar transport system substrate-binding protein/sn-glycerol 3-phosphate transport system substrate-binding protein
MLALVLAVLLIAVACAAPTEAPKPTSAPAPTTAPAQATTAPAAKPTDAPKPTAVPPTAAPKPITINNPPQTPEEVDAIDLMGKKVTVTYWHQRPQAQQEVLQAMLDEFNKTNPYGITAKAEIAGAAYPDVYTKVSAAIQAGQPPEMSVAYQNQAAFYRGSNAVVNIDPFLKSKKYGLSEADLKDYVQAFLDTDQNPQFKNERLGFPTQRSAEVMYVNMDWLKKLGYNEIPKDWKTWEEAACKAADPATKKYGWAFRHDASNFASQVFARGGRILAADGQSYAFNSQAGVDTLAMIQRMFKNKCAVEIPVAERNGEQTRFGNGEVLFVFASSSGMSFYQDAVAKGAKFTWDISLLPQSGAKPALNLYGASASIYKTTPEKELAAWLVIKFLGEKAQTTKWAVATGYLPVRQSAKPDVVTALKANPAWGPVAESYAKIFDWVQYSMIESPVAGYDPVRDNIDKKVMTVVLTDFNVDVKKLLDDAVAEANKILKENAPK